MNRVFVPAFAHKADLVKKSFQNKLPKYYDGAVMFVLDAQADEEEYKQIEGMPERTLLIVNGKSKILEAEAEKQSAILHAEAVREAKVREAEGEAEAIIKVQQATADAIKLLNDANASDAVVKLKALEAFAQAADGQATKIIIPSEIQGLAGLVEGVTETIKK